VIIKDVEIKGFWGHSKASAKFFSDVTIFIGFNGTGKTTFINFISAVLTVDIVQLSSLQFDEITINLIDSNGKARNKSKRKITVTNNREDSSLNNCNMFKYKVGSNIYTVSIVQDPRMKRGVQDIDYFLRFVPSDIRRQYTELKQEISSLVEISQISVYRQAFNENIESDPRQKITAIDERLQQLFERFSRYQLKLETQLNERSTLFQNEALGSLLYNEEFDEFNPRKINSVSENDLETQQEKLLKVFKELGIQGKSEQISKHIGKLRVAIKGLKSSAETKSFSIDDFFALPLISRTNKIIDSLNKSEEDKRKIVEPRQRFFDTLQSFMPNKKFQYDNKKGSFFFSLEGVDNKLFPWSSLSSGEKQLLIQFMEMILQEGKSLIFIADEPELSLHLAWQEKLLEALRNLNENAQLIVATHSPDIVAGFSSNVTDMENVISSTYV
jgi:predicted ATP-dependent endonuclease of OLD family